MAGAIAFRPRMGVEAVKAIAKELHFPNVSRFIEEAILEKAHRSFERKLDPKARRFSDEVDRAVMKYLGIRWVDPSSKLARQIHKDAEAMRTGKVKSYRWKGSIKQLIDDAKHHRYAPVEKK